jgi:hypothetical protein
MRHMLLLVLFITTAAQAQYAPSTPPEGITKTAWKEHWSRAHWAMEEAMRKNPNADRGCLFAVFMHHLVTMEIDASLDGASRAVRKDAAKALREKMDKYRSDNCNGGGGNGGATVSAALDFATDEPDWYASHDPRNSKVAFQGEVAWLYERHKSGMRRDTPIILRMLQLGILVPAVEGAAAMPASIPLPIINPSLFMPKRDPNQGT